MSTRGRSGPLNHQWRGGRTIASNGYILIRVGVNHPLADVRGYAYEHRVVASETTGRLLKPGEQVHHRNGDKTDNRPENLQVLSAAEHRAAHRQVERRARLRLPGEDNPAISCACGCGARFRRYDGEGRPREFLPGHNTRLRTAATRGAVSDRLAA